VNLRLGFVFVVLETEKKKKDLFGGEEEKTITLER